MKNIKKNIILFVAVTIALLMVSSATAVPQTNSEPVMEKIEQLEELEKLMLEQNLGDIFNLAEMDEESIEEAMNQLNNFLIGQGVGSFNVQEMNADFSAENYMAYISSDEFADLFNHDDIQTALNSGDYNDYITNDETINSILNSEFFNSFLNCDFAQQILDNINGGGDSTVINSQTTTQTQQAPLNTGRGNLILEGTTIIGFEQTIQTNPDDAEILYNALFVGLMAKFLQDIQPLPFGGILEAILFLIQQWNTWCVILLIAFNGLPVRTLLAVTMILIIDAIALVAGVVLVGTAAILIVALAIGMTPVLIALAILIFPFYILAIILVLLLGL